MIEPRLAVNPFARRHTPASPFSHYEGTEAELLALAAKHFAAGRPGPRDGVLLVPVPAARFRSSVVLATPKTALGACWSRRAEGEDAFLFPFAVDSHKARAKAVDLVLYRHDALGEQASDPLAAWELVSVNARASDGPEPLSPLAMARNHLSRPGGTPATYTSEAFALSVQYWARRVAPAPDPSPLSGPGFPDLLARYAVPERGEPWVEVVTTDHRLLPETDEEPPPRPFTLIRRWFLSGDRTIPADLFARSVYFWGRRPLPADAGEE